MVEECEDVAKYYLIINEIKPSWFYSEGGFPGSGSIFLTNEVHKLVGQGSFC